MIPRGFDYETRIDVAPIINVSLVVVLTLMLIAPFLSETDKGVDLPEARASEVDDTDNVEIIYTLEREIYIGETPVTAEELQPLLEALFASAPDGVAVVKADQSLLYGDVERLIAKVEAAQAPRIALATRQKDEGGAR
jgi:biopolymer transport protein ExbD